MNILNVGPAQWFTPHFVYTDGEITSFHFDPLQESASLLPDYIRNHRIHALQVFRGDMIREFLNTTAVPHVEWSTEIYPHSQSLICEADVISWRKMAHCLKNRKSAFPFLHYDESRVGFLRELGFPVLPALLGVNMSQLESLDRDIDILFFGRASDRRVKFLTRFKERHFNFVWIEHGLSWQDLAKLICRSKIVLNLSADGNDNFEPRVLLALAGGCHVYSEASLGQDLFLRSTDERIAARVTQFNLNDAEQALTSLTSSLKTLCFSPLEAHFDSNKTFLDALRLLSNTPIRVR